MGYYSANPFDADWEAEAAEDRANRVARAEEEAAIYLNVAKAEAQAGFDATMASLLGVTGPRWNRARDAAKAKFAADTAPARRLYDLTVECILEHGEVSEELSDAWDALKPADLAATADYVVVGDHDPEPRRAA